MNKTIRTVALFSVLSMMAVGCQKEDISNFAPAEYISEASTVCTMHYTIDGVPYQATLRSEAERAEFLRQLVALARGGHEVEFYDADKAGQSVATKETVTFSTTDEKEAAAWVQKMSDNGYRVTVSFDSEKRVYNCVARK